MKFECKDDFYLDGEKFKIISGSIHYFRVVPDYWKDRLKKLKAMGCNTVETYIPWNLHEPQKGIFDFSGILDIHKFVNMAQELGLYVIVRPSPYICGEWEFGGMPGWILAKDGVRLRSKDLFFMEAVEEYYDRLFQILVPLQIHNGGPIILMQVENEYGYYGTDNSYVAAVQKMMIDRGVNVPLITSDGSTEESLSCGSIKGALPTGNFGSKTKERFEILKKYTEGGPLMCTEFWIGWFDHWGNGGHKTGNFEESVQNLDDILSMGHVNIYMFEGGTNFGFMNGSNYYDELTPDVTSYDYDAVLTEDGRITEKYHRYQAIIEKYVQVTEVEMESEICRKAYGKLEVQEKVSLFSILDQLSKPMISDYPVCMEKLGQNYGYILYRSKLEKELNIEKIQLWKANDRAHIFVNQHQEAIYYDRELCQEQELCVQFDRESTLDILVENMGRVNFGPRMEEQRKGIDGCVQINGHMHHHWDIYTLPLDHIDKINFSEKYQEGTPSFYKFKFNVEEKGDTFLELEGWGKGCVFVNGYNIGRFWKIGPQKRLYIPAPLLKNGKNEIVVFETDGETAGDIALMDTPDIG